VKAKRICAKEGCLRVLSKNTKGIYCNSHRDRTGVKPVYNFKSG